MKNLLIIATALMAIAGFCATAQSQVAPTPAPAAEAAQPSPLDDSLKAIQNAPDVAAAQKAFDAGTAIRKDDTQLNGYFMVRMVELGAPDKAYDQAKFLSAQDKNDALAMAVLAYGEAGKGNMSEALTQIALALFADAKDPFILRTAGQLTAWLDQNPKGRDIPKYLRDSMADARKAAAGQKDFEDAYAEAQAAYKELAAAKSQPATAAPELLPADAPDPNAQPVQGTPDDQNLPIGQNMPVGQGTPVEGAPADGYPQYPDYPEQVAGDGGYATEPPPAEIPPTVVYNTTVYNPPPVIYYNTIIYPVNQVVFIGTFRHHGLLVGRSCGGFIFVDHSRNIYVGRSHDVYVDRSNHVVVRNAHKADFDRHGNLVGERTPARLTVNDGKVVERRAERPASPRLGSDSRPRTTAGPRPDPRAITAQQTQLPRTPTAVPRIGSTRVPADTKTPVTERPSSPRTRVYGDTAPRTSVPTVRTADPTAGPSRTVRTSDPTRTSDPAVRPSTPTVRDLTPTVRPSAPAPRPSRPTVAPDRSTPAPSKTPAPVERPSRVTRVEPSATPAPSKPAPSAPAPRPSRPDSPAVKDRPETPAPAPTVRERREAPAPSAPAPRPSEPDRRADRPERPAPPPPSVAPGDSPRVTAPSRSDSDSPRVSAPSRSDSDRPSPPSRSSSSDDDSRRSRR